jgi:uncharacterized protein YecE (DUF72 family)
LDCYIGTSGWHYDHWREQFYPVKLPKAKWLEFYSGYFNTVELNNSFYRLPSEAAFSNWRDSTPGNFTFAVKVSRFITHIRRLRDTEEALEKFIVRAKILGEKLGPILYQLPPSMHRNDGLLESFLSTLPQGLKHVIEFRHQSWFEDGVYQILRKYNAGFCIFDMPSVSCPLVVTADFIYIRFHGSTGLYWSCYSDEELDTWVKRLVALAKDSKKVFAYFNNDAGGYAIKNALTLVNILKAKIG